MGPTLKKFTKGDNQVNDSNKYVKSVILKVWTRYFRDTDEWELIPAHLIGNPSSMCLFKKNDQI